MRKLTELFRQSDVKKPNMFEEESEITFNLSTLIFIKCLRVHK